MPCLQSSGILQLPFDTVTRLHLSGMLDPFFYVKSNKWCKTKKRDSLTTHADSSSSPHDLTVQNPTNNSPSWQLNNTGGKGGYRGDLNGRRGGRGGGRYVGISNGGGYLHGGGPNQASGGSNQASNDNNLTLDN